jgi:hypothetical protein
MKKTKTTKNKTPTETKAKPRRTPKLDKLMAQGTWTETTLPDGRTMPAFVMPTPELQAELEETLEKKIKADLKANGWCRVCGPNRDHPFHSELLRQRIDEMAEWAGSSQYSSIYMPELFTAEGRARYRRLTLRYEREFLNQYEREFRKQHGIKAAASIDDHIAKMHKEALEHWRKAFEHYRDLRKNPGYWKGTMDYKFMFPEEGPVLLDGPPPPPVFTKDGCDLVLSFKDGSVDLWFRCSGVIPCDTAAATGSTCAAPDV